MRPLQLSRATRLGRRTYASVQLEVSGPVTKSGMPSSWPAEGVAKVH